MEKNISKFYDIWEAKDLCQFLRHTVSLLELYDIDDEDDWVAKEVGQDNETNVRILRTMYIVVRFAEIFSGKIARTKAEFKGLYQKMEKMGQENQDLVS